MNFSDQLNLAVTEAFAAAGFPDAPARVTVSNRPDLCEYQCNGAMAGARLYHTSPMAIAEKVVPFLAENPAFSKAEAVAPGFINLDVSTAYLKDFAVNTLLIEKFGVNLREPKNIVVDYGGPNVAKPLHIGHLRSAIIGEAIKRMLIFMGNQVTGDAHLGDWGLQIGLIIQELKVRKPELPYFDPDFKGAYPEEAPFTISELEEIYPAASAKSKEDAAYLSAAHENTLKLQSGDPAYRAIWQHIIDISVADLQKNYKNLDVSFELWGKESDADPYIPELLQTLKEKGLSYLSNGATVVDVQEESDKREVPPCIVIKSDGAALYATTDLATIIYRNRFLHPDIIIYITDKRQELHFTQVFRVAKKAGIIPEETVLTHIGYGTMNGKDGKPFKTRTGGVMRLESLISDINDAVYEKMKERYAEEELCLDTVKKVGLSAIKYGDLSNQAMKDYNFDIDRFAAFEGNTGPYILYTIVRIKSILGKASDYKEDLRQILDLPTDNGSIHGLLKALAAFPEMMENAVEELAPHKICSYIYQVSDAFNGFYHETPILKEEDPLKKQAYLSLASLTKQLLETCIGILGFDAPEKM